MDPDGASLRAVGLTKVFRSGAGEVRVLDGLTLEIAAGEQAALVGESGSGKTTLLYLLGALDRPTSGEVWWGTHQPKDWDPAAIARFRGRHIGFVWQQWSLLSEFSALENVEMPLRIAGRPAREARERARYCLNEVGLSHRETHRPGELSGGEQQRVALARALAPEPSYLLADEPTGNLDAKTGDRIITLVRELQRRHRFTSVIVTHNQELASGCDRVFTLEDGRIRGLTMEDRSYV
jgi:lipoprotein-releasing system ATP-binding protein